MPTTCFLLTPTDIERTYYRRYSAFVLNKVDKSCKDGGEYHNALVHVQTDRGQNHMSTCLGMSPAHKIIKEDPRWPTKCADCNYLFHPEVDQWQVFVEDVWVNDLGIEFTLSNAPAGAMWHAYWLDERRKSAGIDRAPDGKNLIVVCPGGADWWIDGPANNGPGWDRVGIAPKITCTPSIDVGNYHGFLRDGVFTDDLEGRKYQ